MGEISCLCKKIFMASGKFRIKTNNDWNTVYYRFKQGSQFDAEISTGIQVPKGRWSITKQQVLSTREINYKYKIWRVGEFHTEGI
jgi:hypothetical protein